MKTTIKTIKGWANNTDFFTNENTNNNTFINNLNKYLADNKIIEKGYKKLNTSFDNLKGKGASEKIVIKGRYWAGNWASHYKQTYTVYYK
jgi:hypothetical protein